MWLDDVARLLERVRRRRCAEVVHAFAGLLIKDVARVRAAWPQPQFHDLAIHVEVLVEVHLRPVLQSAVTRVGIDSAEADVRIPHGLQHDSLHRLAVGIEDRDRRVERRFAASRVDLEDPRLPGFRFEAKQIDVGFFRIAFAMDAAFDFRGQFECRGFVDCVVRFGLGSLLRRQILGDRDCRDLVAVGCALFGRDDGQFLNRTIRSAYVERTAIRRHRQSGRDVRLLFVVVQLSKLAGLPQLQRAVIGDRDQRLAVRREIQLRDRALVSNPGVNQRVDLRLVF